MSYTPCEFCNGRHLEFRQKMWDALLDKNIAPERFINEDPQGRLDLIKEGFGLTNDHRSDQPNISVPRNQGAVVVKPEMIHADHQLEEYLVEKVGVEITRTKSFVYTPEEYWQISGRGMFEHFYLFPHGALLFLSSIVATSRLILFDHRPVQEYLRIFREYNDGIEPDNLLNNKKDQQYVFNCLFVRHEQNSLRSSITFPVVKSRGMLEMIPDRCPAKCWDFTGSFSNRTPAENARTFNGIHSPNNREELILELSILSVQLISDYGLQ